MTPEGKLFIFELEEQPNKIKFIEYEQVSDNNLRIKKVELRLSQLTPKELRITKFHIITGCPEISVTYDIGDAEKDFTTILVDESLIEEVPPYPNHEIDIKDWHVAKHFQKSRKNSFQGAFNGLSEKYLREMLLKEEAKENYEMCAAILKYAESKGFHLK